MIAFDILAAVASLLILAAIAVIVNCFQLKMELKECLKNCLKPVINVDYGYLATFRRLLCYPGS